MIEFTPGGYDKNVGQIRREARAALLAEVLAVVDEEWDIPKWREDLDPMTYQESAEDGRNVTLYRIRTRIAALGEQDTEASDG